MPTLPATACSVALSLGICLSVLGTTVHAQLPPSPDSLATGAQRYLGAASCAASNCHGGTTLPDSGPKYAAHRIWIKDDPHSRAYEVLCDERSQRMTARLGWQPAHKEARCLACHAVAENPSHTFSSSFQVSDGVSCEACHGPAEQWLDDHSRPQIWHALTVAEKERRGFRSLEPLELRAKFCVTCHVGATDREVNHDMIAAGHPRLAFEYAGYSAILKKHWRLEDDQFQASGEIGTAHASTMLDTQLWLIGQVATVRATLELTRHRAESSEKPWPEFAEYRCFACHQSLTAEGSPKSFIDWANNPALWDVDRAGVMPWQPASLGAIGFIEPEPPLVVGPLRQLRSELGNWHPDRGITTQQATAALQALDHLTLTSQDVATPVRVLNRVGAKENHVERDWEHAMQAYLAVAALSPATSKRQPEFLAQVEILRQALRFKAGTDSPGQYDESRGQTIRAALDRLHELASTSPTDTVPPPPTRQP
ncbi:hypothetical protein GC163_00710 [bacterium]|nr:hypothetical protein [bacterium]